MLQVSLGNLCRWHAVFMFLVVGIHRPSLADDDSPIPEWAAHQSITPVSWPEELVGRLQTGDQKPLPDVKVTLTITAQIWRTGGLFETTLHTDEAVTDQDGFYQFSTGELPEFSHRPLVVYVSADVPDLVPWRTWHWIGPRQNSVPRQLPQLRLKPGREMSGTCVNELGEVIPDVTLHLTWLGRTPGGWGLKHVKSDEQGRFCFRMPASGQVAAFAVSDDHGPAYFRFDLGRTDKRQLKLTRGTRIYGLARTADNKPFRDAIIEAVSVGQDNIPGMTSPFRVACRADEKGRFRLPPLSGRYKLYFTEASPHLADGGTAVSESQAPKTAPREVILKDGNRENLVLRATATATVSGTIIDEDDSPANRVSVRLYQRPDGNGVGFLLDQTYSDRNGRYRLETPVPIERMVIYIEARGRKGKVLRPQATKLSDVLKQNGSYVNGEQVEGDVTADFQFKVVEE